MSSHDSDLEATKKTVEVQKESKEAPICQAELDAPEPEDDEDVPHYATLRRRPKGTEQVTCYRIDGDSNNLMVPTTEKTTVVNVTDGKAREKSWIKRDTTVVNVVPSTVVNVIEKAHDKILIKTEKTLGEKDKVQKSRAPPLTHLFSKPPTPTRRPPTRWLSAKKAFEERPIVLKVMERTDFSMLAHYTETPV